MTPEEIQQLLMPEDQPRRPMGLAPDVGSLLSLGPDIAAPIAPRFPTPSPNFLDRLALAFQGLPQVPLQQLNPGAAFLQGLMGGFGQARGQGFQRQVSDVQEQNQRLTEAARHMANQRWQQYQATKTMVESKKAERDRLEKIRQFNETERRLREQGRPKTLEEYRAISKAQAQGHWEGAPPVGPKPKGSKTATVPQKQAVIRAADASISAAVDPLRSQMARSKYDTALSLWRSLAASDSTVATDPEIRARMAAARDTLKARGF